jgi:hypothetical protein
MPGAKGGAPSMENPVAPSNAIPQQTDNPVYLDEDPADLSASSARPDRAVEPHRRHSARTVVIGFVIATLAGVTGCSSPPRNSDDVCAIFGEKHSWYRATRRTRERWQIPQSVQMAVIFQESSYRARARPPRSRLLWVIPWRRPSSAYGFAQVVRPTWETYLQSTANPRARRDNFWDASDFIGWYMSRIVRGNEIPPSDARSLYLAYHEGSGGYKRGTHLKKDWLLKVSRRVGQRAARYKSQLDICREKLERQRWWWPF